MYAERIEGLARQFRHDRAAGRFHGTWQEYLRSRHTTSTTSTTNNPADVDFDNLVWDAIESQISNPMVSSASAMKTDVSRATGNGPGLGPGCISGPIIKCAQDSAHNSDLIFKKQRQYSYGFANTATFSSGVENGTRITQISTSLALIPVDFLPFYLTPAEYQSLPEGSYVKEVKCSVEFVGVRTLFDTGTTLTGVANSVACILSCVGLNLRMQGRNVTYTTNAESLMIPAGIAALPVSTFTNKWYNNWASTCMGIPRSLSGYWMIQVNDTENKTANYPLNKHEVYIAPPQEK